MNLYDNLVQASKLKSSYYYKKTRTNPILSPSRSSNFIQEYLKYGSKSKLLDFPFYDKYKTNSKIIHTTSMYFIGILLKDLVSQNLSEKISELIGSSDDYPFTYIWFLSSLYHDAAFCEERIILENSLSKFTGKINELKEKYQLTNCLLDLELNTKELDIFSPYTMKCYLNYLIFRASSCNQDHGIVAGLLFYDLLLKNYERAWSEFSYMDKKNGSHDKFTHDGLSWKKEHLELFKLVSFSLMGHNLWKQDDYIVHSFNLDVKLSIEDDFRVEIHEYPLLFYIGLIDAIEPCKAFVSLNPKVVWQAIDIKLDSIAKIIVLKVIDDKIDADVWFKRVYDLKEWLNVSIEKVNDNLIQIKIL